MSGHQTTAPTEQSWLTPLSIVRALGAFDLDPCGCTPQGDDMLFEREAPWPTAARILLLPEDGLRATWSGRVWLNPPYEDVESWMARLASHDHGTALVFARTDAAWFHEHVWRRASALLFLRRLVRAGRVSDRWED